MDQSIFVTKRDKSGLNTGMTRAMHPKLEELLGLIGGFIEHWGFRKAEGKVWALIYLSAQPLSGQEIAQRLDLSKAMVSLSVTKLMEFGVIQEVDRGAGRTTFYDSVPDLEATIFNVLRTREKGMLREIQEAVGALKASSKKADLKEEISSKRLQSLGRLVESGQDLLELILKFGKIRH